jgi:hypothetical protein
MAADSDTDQYLMVAKFGVRLAVSKERTHRVHMEKFNLKKSKEIGVESSIVLKSQVGSNLWNTYTLWWILIDLGKLSERKSKIQPGRLFYYELKKHKP